VLKKGNQIGKRLPGWEAGCRKTGKKKVGLGERRNKVVVRGEGSGGAFRRNS